MDRDRFWEIIENSRKQAGGDQAAQSAALYDLLGPLSAEEVASCHDHFVACLRAARRDDLRVAATIIDGFWVSTDAFQDFRSWLVSMGREVYEVALRDPDSLADVLERDDAFEFEEFCYIPGRVWEEKTGRRRQYMHPEPQTAPAPDVPEEEDEEEEELEQKFPRLRAKFPED